MSLLAPRVRKLIKICPTSSTIASRSPSYNLKEGDIDVTVSADFERCLDRALQVARMFPGSKVDQATTGPVSFLSGIGTRCEVHCVKSTDSWQRDFSTLFNDFQVGGVGAHVVDQGTWDTVRSCTPQYKRPCLLATLDETVRHPKVVAENREVL